MLGSDRRLLLLRLLLRLLVRLLVRLVVERFLVILSSHWLLLRYGTLAKVCKHISSQKNLVYRKSFRWRFLADSIQAIRFYVNTPA